MFWKLESEFEPLITEDTRIWSKSDYILWLNIATECNLNCRYCHEHIPRNVKWLNAKDLDNIIKLFNPRKKYHLSPALGDILLSPNKFELLEYCLHKGHSVNLFSYFPKFIDLEEVNFILDQFPNTCICWSLHGDNDNDRENIFNQPHKISDVLNILKPSRTLLHRIYVFSTNINALEPYIEMVNRCKGSAELCFMDFIDYSSDTIIRKQISGYKYVKARPEVLELIYGRQFRVKDSV